MARFVDTKAAGFGQVFGRKSNHMHRPFSRLGFSQKLHDKPSGIVHHLQPSLRAKRAADF